jgi:hypothetical protein
MSETKKMNTPKANYSNIITLADRSVVITVNLD